MKVLRNIGGLKKAISGIDNLGFVPTMGGLHKGHISLIKKSQKKCKKTLVSIYVNPKQFNKSRDFLSYPRNLNKDLIILRKLKVDFLFLPITKEIYKNNYKKIILPINQKILCAKYRKGHFEGVLDIMNRLVNLIYPKRIFLGEKDYQQFFLVKKFIEKKYPTRVFLCKTIRNSNYVALSTRNNLLNKNDLKICAVISHELINLKNALKQYPSEKRERIKFTKQKIINKFGIKIEYLESRNLINLSKKITNKPFKIFIAYYLNKVRLIDNF